MKSIFFVATVLLSALTIVAQEPTDALRYSWYTQSGTARQQAVGGAMGSLGGDISATFVNPAGLAFYKTGDFVFTPGFSLLNNKSTYFGRNEKDKKNNFYLGTTGFVLGGGSSQGRRLRGSAISLAVNRTANFSSRILYRGSKNQSSYSQKFLEEISNGNIKDANAVAQNYPFGTRLAFNTYWIDTVAGGSSGNFQFQSRAVPLLATGLLQQNEISSKGGITEIALGAGGNYGDKLYVGFSLAFPILNYERQSTFTEADSTNNTGNKFDFASITENLRTKGTGVNLKAGIIYKPSEFVRLGLAIHSPTYYQLTDKYNASVTTNTENYQGQLTQSSSDLVGQDAQFKYWMFTPFRVIGSVSYVVHEIQDVRQQKGFLTADIEYVNYKGASYTTDPGSNDQGSKDYLKSLNKAIDKAYKGAFNFRAGGELKFTTVMVRLGAAYYGNPYQDINGEKGSRFHLSGGLGYRNKGLFVDLTYIYTIAKDVNFPYRLQYTAYSGANVKGNASNILVTVGFKI